MARTIQQIKKSMTDEFVADPTIRELYGLGQNDTFESAFSLVSVESILFGIVATATFVLESIFDAFRREVDRKIASSIVATIPWYHKVCLEYQHGDKLVLNPTTYEYGYEQVDASKQLVKYAACRDRGGGVYVLVAGQGADGYPQSLADDVLLAFKEYMNKRKIVGVVMEVFSYDPDDISVSMKIQYDPVVMNDDGSLISDPSVYPVEEAVNSYLANIVYGGTFNINKMIDAIQGAAGVVDLQVEGIEAKPANSESFTEVTGNNYTSMGGSFKAINLRNTISYVLTI